MLNSVTKLAEGLASDNMLRSVINLDYDILIQLDDLEDSINREEINKLEYQAQRCQAKFNYYNKMSQEIIKRVELIRAMGGNMKLVRTDVGVPQITPQFYGDDSWIRPKQD